MGYARHVNYGERINIYHCGKGNAETKTWPGKLYQMKDRSHLQAMAEYFRADPAYAAELLADVRSGGDQDELAILMRQMDEAFMIDHKLPGSASEEQS